MSQRNWYCPNCTEWAHTVDGSLTPYHICVGNKLTAGFPTPLVQVGISTKIIVNEREDFIGEEVVQFNDSGRPIMSIASETAQGVSLNIFAPCASGGGEAKKE